MMDSDNLGTLIGRIGELGREKAALLRDMQGLSWFAREHGARRLAAIEAEVELCFTRIRARRAALDAEPIDPLVAERRRYTREVFGNPSSVDGRPVTEPETDAAPELEVASPSAPSPSVPAAAAAAPVRTLRAPKRDWLAMSTRARAAS